MQMQSTILIAAASEEVRGQLRQIFQNDYQILEAQSTDQVQLVLADYPGQISVLLADTGLEESFCCEELASVIQNASSREVPVLVLLEGQDKNGEILAYQYGPGHGAWCRGSSIPSRRNHKADRTRPGRN